MYVRYVDPLSLQAFCRCWWECEEKGQNFDRVYYRQKSSRDRQKIQNLEGLLGRARHPTSRNGSVGASLESDSPNLPAYIPNHIHTWFIFVRSYPGYSWHSHSAELAAPNMTYIHPLNFEISGCCLLLGVVGLGENC